MHPTLQISAAEEYSDAPKSNSGGLYHNVMACGDSRVLGVPYILARPKSASFIVPSLRKRQLSGFKSLAIMIVVCLWSNQEVSLSVMRMIWNRHEYALKEETKIALTYEVSIVRDTPRRPAITTTNAVSYLPTKSKWPDSSIF